MRDTTERTIVTEMIDEAVEGVSMLVQRVLSSMRFGEWYNEKSVAGGSFLEWNSLEAVLSLDPPAAAMADSLPATASLTPELFCNATTLLPHLCRCRRMI